MIDRIGGGFPLPPARTATPASTTAPPSPVASVAGVKPDLSTLAATGRDLAASPPVDSAKVDRIRHEIAVGSYKIDAGAIAEKMIALDLPHND